MLRWLITALSLASFPACGPSIHSPSIRAVRFGPIHPPRGVGCDASFLEIDVQQVGLGFETIASLHLSSDTLDERERTALREEACALGGNYLVPSLQVQGMAAFFVVRPRPGVVVRDGKLVLARAPIAAKGDRPIVAVVPLDDRANPLGREARDQLTVYLATRLAGEGRLRVVPPDATKARLRAEKREGYRDCYDTRCQIELGKALAAEKALVGQLLKVGSVCSLVANLYDLKTEASEAAATASIPCTVEGVRRGVDQIVDKLR